MKSKWIINIKGFESFRFGEDSNLYRLPYQKDKRAFNLRLIKLQKSNRWIVNGKAWSKRQLEGKIIKDPNPIELTREENNYPF